MPNRYAWILFSLASAALLSTACLSTAIPGGPPVVPPPVEMPAESDTAVVTTLAETGVLAETTGIAVPDSDVASETASQIVLPPSAPDEGEQGQPDQALPLPEQHEVTVEDSGITTLNRAAFVQSLSQLAPGELSGEEAQGILTTREQEKAARDAYLALLQAHELPILARLAAAAETRLEATGVLIERYGQPDPAAGRGMGAFEDPAFQVLYNRWVEQGRWSAVDALRAGAEIEELDIVELEKRLAQTDQADLQLVYGSLLLAARNHLRVVVWTMEAQKGEIYEPQHLAPEVYDEIINTYLEQPAGRG